MNMSWSRYNCLFHSRQFGYFLFNARSAVLLELDAYHYNIAQRLQEKGAFHKSQEEADFFQLLEDCMVLVDEQDDERWLLQQRYRRNLASFSTETLGLVICPTLACNFNCPYCFESTHHDRSSMSDKTADELLRFVEWHSDTRQLLVTWYGGEPTLAFERLVDLTRKFQKRYPDRYKADLVTNGFELDRQKIRSLESLNITKVQITLDGLEDTHNKRRPHMHGKPTFRRILDAVDMLLHSSYTGTIDLRVNIDHTNQEEYPALLDLIRQRFDDKKVKVYPGHINTVSGKTHTQCALCGNEWLELAVDTYFRHGIVPPGALYPQPRPFTICTATSHYGYIVGPEGELYKCWEDVGKPERVVGTVSCTEALEESELTWRYMTGTDPYHDPSCQECPVLPVCGGGCPNKRLRALQFNEKDLEYCAPFKDRLEQCLEVYCDLFRTRELCNVFLGESENPGLSPSGYRVIHQGAQSTHS